MSAEIPHRFSEEEISWNFDGEHFYWVVRKIEWYKKLVQNLTEDQRIQMWEPIIVAEECADVWVAVVIMPTYLSNSSNAKYKNDVSIKKLDSIGKWLPSESEQEAKLYKVVSLVRRTVEKNSVWKMTWGFVIETSMHENWMKKTDISYTPDEVVNF